jgi:hypothetical protein
MTGHLKIFEELGLLPASDCRQAYSNSIPRALTRRRRNGPDPGRYSSGTLPRLFRSRAEHCLSNPLHSLIVRIRRGDFFLGRPGLHLNHCLSTLLLESIRNPQAGFSPSHPRRRISCCKDFCGPSAAGTGIHFGSAGASPDPANSGSEPRSGRTGICSDRKKHSRGTIFPREEVEKRCRGKP